MPIAAGAAMTATFRGDLAGESASTVGGFPIVSAGIVVVIEHELAVIVEMVAEELDESRPDVTGNALEVLPKVTSSGELDGLDDDGVAEESAGSPTLCDGAGFKDETAVDVASAGVGGEFSELGEGFDGGESPVG